MQIRTTLKKSPGISGYLYAKGTFYIHILEAEDIRNINRYMESVSINTSFINRHNGLRVVHQSYENEQRLFKNW